MRQFSDDMRQKIIGMSPELPAGQQPLVRGAMTHVVLRLVASLGHDAEGLARRHQVDPLSIQRPYIVAPLAGYLALFEEAAGLVGNPLFGLDVGASFHPMDIGTAGQLFGSGASIWRGLRRMVLHVECEQDQSWAALEDDGAQVTFSYRIMDDRLWPRRQDAESVLFDACNVIWLSYDRDWCPLEIHFEHAAPAEDVTRELERRFRAPVLFGQPANRIVTTSLAAHHVWRSEDPEAIALLERHMRDFVLHPGERSDLVRRVIVLIDRELSRQPITLDLVAGELALSTRSLQRRLRQDDDTSLRQLVQQRRMAIARQALDDGRKSIAEIAESLGYADATAFWRAYRDWTGAAPSLSAGRRSEALGEGAD